MKQKPDTLKLRQPIRMSSSSTQISKHKLRPPTSIRKGGSSKMKKSITVPKGAKMITSGSKVDKSQKMTVMHSLDEFVDTVAKPRTSRLIVDRDTSQIFRDS